jgi:rhodanese-related sulfurtransferase
MLSVLMALSIFLSNCSNSTTETIKTTTALPRWIWTSSGNSDYSIVIDRNTKQPITDVSPDEAFGITGTSQFLGNPVIIDVRTPQEYASGYINGAVNIDIGSPTFKDEIGKLDKNKTYIVYCRTGVRSAAARDIMEGLGFQHVINVLGGITAWEAAGLPVEK